MTLYPTPRQREQFAAGLRALADYIESNPDVPCPWSADALVFPLGGNDAEKQAEIDAIGERIGAEPRFTYGGHYTVKRLFGPVEYRAVAIPHDNDESE
jgi:hypothetical protein